MECSVLLLKSTRDRMFSAFLFLILSGVERKILLKIDKEFVEISSKSSKFDSNCSELRLKFKKKTLNHYNISLILKEASLIFKHFLMTS